jgi:hypothetical protein
VGNETVIGMTAILGYARVSTTGQDLETQLAALSAAGVGAERVFTDKLSGSARTDRPGLAAMLDYARASDTVVVTAIDRLGRSVAEVTRTIADLGERRILLRALREGIDTAPPQDGPWRGSWLPSPSLNSNSAENGVPHHANRAGSGACRPLNPQAQSTAPRTVAALGGGR